MDINPESISLVTKTFGSIYMDSKVFTIDIDILYGDEQEKIGEAKVYEVRMDRIVNYGECDLFEVFDGHSSDLSGLYEELFVDDELIPAVEDELLDYGNIVVIKSILLKPEYRGQGLSGILALAIAERFNDRDIVALKPWPMGPHEPENSTGDWELPQLAKTEQKIIANKLRKGYMKAGFKPLFRGSNYLYLTHCRHPTATQLIDKRNMDHGVPDTF